MAEINEANSCAGRWKPAANGPADTLVKQARARCAAGASLCGAGLP